MEIPTFMYNVLPSKKREELINQRNVRVIKEFLKKREQLKIARENEITHLKQLRKDKSIRASTYRRMKRETMVSYEQKRMDLIKASVEKSVGTSKSFVRIDGPTSEEDPSLMSIVENN